MSWQAKLAVFTLCIFFTSASYTMLIPFLPLYLLELGADPDSIEQESALIFSISFLIGGIMAPIWGRLADEKGKKAMAVRAAVMLCIANTSGGIVQTPFQLLLMRIIQGFANGYLPTTLSIVSSFSPRERLGSSMSFIQSAQLTGTVSGPLLGGLLSTFFGLRMSFFVAGIFLALVTIITLFTPVKEDTPAQPEVRQGSLLSDIRRSFTEPAIRERLLICFTFKIVVLAIQPILTLYVAQLTGSFDNVTLMSGIACSLPPLAGALLSPFWGVLGQRRGYYFATAMALAGAGFFLFIQGFATSFTFLLLSSLGMGLFIVGVMPGINALLSLNTPPDFRGRGFGMMTMTGQFGAMFGPLLSAAVAVQFSLNAQFMLSGGILFLLSLYTGGRFMAQRRDKIQGRSDRAGIS